MIRRIFRARTPKKNGVNFGDLRRLTPLCTDWGFSRGQVIGRYYVEKFLRKYASDAQGSILEFGEPRYRSFFDQRRIERYEVLDIVAKEGVTLIGDIQDVPSIVDETYDTVVCTQVLEHVPNPFKASAELHRILKKGGTLLLTVPHVNKIHRVPGDFWRFTEDSLAFLFKEFSEAEIVPYGNVLTTALFGYGISSDELSELELDTIDSSYPVIFGCRAIR